MDVISGVLALAAALVGVVQLVRHLTNTDPAYLAIHGSQSRFSQFLKTADEENARILLRGLIDDQLAAQPYLHGSDAYFKKSIAAQEAAINLLLGFYSKDADSEGTKTAQEIMEHLRTQSDILHSTDGNPWYKKKASKEDADKYDAAEREKRELVQALPQAFMK